MAAVTSMEYERRCDNESRRRGLLFVGALATLVATSAVGSPPAYGSCSMETLRSVHAFTGTVVSLTAQDRVATEMTDAANRVKVIGAAGDWKSGVITSVDRTYEVGVRYEFHPLNAASPYRDNSCTATHQLTGASSPTSTPPSHPSPGAGGRWPPAAAEVGGVEPIEEVGLGSPTAAALTLGGAVLLTSLAAAYVFLRRRHAGAA